MYLQHSLPLFCARVTQRPQAMRHSSKPRHLHSMISQSFLHVKVSCTSTYAVYEKRYSFYIRLACHVLWSGFMHQVYYLEKGSITPSCKHFPWNAVVLWIWCTKHVRLQSIISGITFNSAFMHILDSWSNWCINWGHSHIQVNMHTCIRNKCHTLAHYIITKTKAIIHTR